MKKAASAVMFVFLLLGFSASALAPVSVYVDVSVSQAKQMIDSNPDLVILDVRTQSEYDAGHIQNATLIPVSELAGRLSELDKNKEILVYCASGGRSATASQTLVDNGFSKVYNMLGGITAWKSAGYWIEIIHNGDLIVSGTQTLTIENCTYIQTGNILIEDLAELTIKNSELIMKQAYYLQFNISVRQSAGLRAYNTTMKTDSPISSINIYVFDDATATIQGLTLQSGTLSSYGDSTVDISNSTIVEVACWDASKILIVDSRVFGLMDLYFDRYSSFTLVGMKPGFQSHWSLNEAAQGVIHPNCQLTLENTTIDFWSVGMDYDATATIENCSIARIGIDIFDEDVQLDSINACYYPNLNLKSIQLVNSSVTGHWIFGLHNATVMVTNSTINFNLHDQSKATIQDSRMFYVHASFYTGEIELRRVFLGEVSTPREIAKPIISFYWSDFSLSGDIELANTTQVLAWVSTNVTRNYNIISRDINGSSVADVELTLYDQNNTVVWNGITDSIGKANFNLTFTDDNYTDALRLEASMGELFAAKDIAFLSDTPVTLVMNTTATADINNDGSVDIYDAILLANSYNSIPTSPNWNSKADLNSDNIVDIYDAIILANHYNEHYP